MGGYEREFAYKPKWTVIAVIAIFFGLGAVVIGAKASANNRGLIINRIVELGPDEATGFYWVLTALSIVFVAGSAFLAYHRLSYRQRIAFGPETLVVPVSRWSRFEKDISYRDIRELSTAKIGVQRFLYVWHSAGKYTIATAMLPSKAAFEEICELLAAKMREAQLAEQRSTYT